MNSYSTFLKIVFILILSSYAVSLNQANAQLVDAFRAELDGAQAGNSGVNATGVAIVCLNESQDELSIDIQFNGLSTSAITGCHVRIGGPGANGPIVFGLVNPNDDPDDFVDLGTGFTSVWDLDDPAINLQTQLPALQAEFLHILVFTEAFPGGFIRGQIESVLMGDINQDGFTNLIDVSFFVNLLILGEYLLEADFDKNGVVNLIDIQPFVELISN